MDVLAATESIIPNSDHESTEEKMKAEPEDRAKGDNPFQQAISVWRGIYACRFDLFSEVNRWYRCRLDKPGPET